MTNRKLSSRDFNMFSLGLATRFAERATGQDEDSLRLLDARPADHVLVGFLTPAGASDDGDDTPDDEQLAEELPSDSAYEQTNIGMYWFMPEDAFHGGAVLESKVRLSVYVRRLPTRNEQQQALWRVPHRVARAHAQTDEPPPKQANARPVWTREDLPEISIDPIELQKLATIRRFQVPLGDDVRAALNSRDRTALYPGRRPLLLEESDVEDEESFDTWLSGVPHGNWPLNWQPVLDARLSAVPTEPGVVRIAVRIVNRTPAVPRQSAGYVDANLYGVRLSLRVDRTAYRAMVFRELPQSFRYDRRLPAVGINSHVDVTLDDSHVSLQTQSVPLHVAQRLEPRTIPKAPPNFEVLAEDPLPTLSRILEAMRTYDSQEWSRCVQTLSADREVAEAMEARETFRQEIERFAHGIDLLADPNYPHVKRAFALMNRAMANASGGRYSEWRLFQIVFIVSQLSTLAAREYPELERRDDDHVDILWFAAGGGKTEAFLGLLLWQAFFDRLRGKTFGVTAFVRFPLRLLTFQQLQRLGTVLASAERLRQSEELGGARFSIGYFVGRNTTPNRIDNDTHQRFQEHGPDSKLQRVYSCPFCDAATELSYDASQRLVEHRCTAATSGCPNGDQRLPVYVVDADVYRFLPTAIVSTVDKLAQFGQNQRFAQLMGRINVLCPIHGASFLGANRLCPATRALDRGERPEKCGDFRLHYGPFHDPHPSLLIQDELHLLTEELGTFDAHYETGVMEFVRALGGRPWKIIAATATIERFREHAWNLYLRPARQFPGPGPQAYESFYYTQSSERLGRVFVGVLGVGRKHTPAVTRALTLIYLELQHARELAAQDVDAACARYELSGLDEDALQDLIFFYELVLTYVLTRKGSDQVAEAIESRVKSELQDLTPDHGGLIVDTFNGGVPEAEMSAAIERIRNADSDQPADERLRGLVATNVIGHGVDIDRFNLMVFAGFPRLVAEYIQASARVGRKVPGLSLLIVTPQSERDRSVFDRFVKFHEYLDRLVDPSAITRWPEPAMRRTVPGLLSGYLMGLAAERISMRLGTVEQVQDAKAHGFEPLLIEEIMSWMKRAYGADLAPSDRYRNQLEVTVQNRYSSVINRSRSHGSKPQALNIYLGSMQSLRDTDDPAFITVNRPRHAAILRRLVRG